MNERLRSGAYFLGAIATLSSCNAAFSSADRFRRAESAEASCSPVGVLPPERIRWSASTAKARPRRLFAQRMQSDRCASSGAAAAARSRPSTASSTCDGDVARCWASSASVCERIELSRQLGRSEGGTNRAVPVHLAALAPAPGDQEADKERQQGDDHRQENPAQRLGARRRLRGNRGRRGGGVGRRRGRRALVSSWSAEAVVVVVGAVVGGTVVVVGAIVVVVTGVVVVVVSWAAAVPDEDAEQHRGTRDRAGTARSCGGETLGCISPAYGQRLAGRGPWVRT